MEHTNTMKEVINVVSDYHPRPKWRYVKEGEGSGEEFREKCLLQPLKDNKHVTINLTGYNRYGPSFISEAFGGLIREHNFTLEFLREHISISHELLPTIVSMCWEEIEKASKEKK
ncbi:STAS-like domain-containing protein [Shewanella sediminis]|uniref:STAS-like domain-containing protein n=1 Tax=Shewanella sediminis TaxID=271097 RepID=UPI00059C1D06|nr:STAS-like domain-containing protein [Shewanella sediminis]